MAQRHEIDRRGFLTTLILIPVGVKLIGCGEDEEGGLTLPDAGLCDGLEALSTTARNHEHLLCVPLADLEEPPEGGVEYDTDTTAEVRQAHIHKVALTQAQLLTIAENGEVTVVTSTDLDHEHSFTLSVLAA